MLILLVLPKMMNTNDPELKKEMEESMKMFSPNQSQLPDMSDMMAKFFGGNTPQPKKLTSKSTSGRVGKSSKRRNKIEWFLWVIYSQLNLCFPLKLPFLHVQCLWSNRPVQSFLIHVSSYCISSVTILFAFPLLWRLVPHFHLQRFLWLTGKVLVLSFAFSAMLFHSPFDSYWMPKREVNGSRSRFLRLRL